MKWVTRERPKTDRIACPWLIKNFIDAEAEFLYVPAGEVPVGSFGQGPPSAKELERRAKLARGAG